MTTKIPKGSRKVTTKQEKQALRNLWIKQYTELRWSIRQIAIAAGRSYGMVHKTLAEGKVTFRARGGHPREKKQ